jgi:hypothetical protein
MKYIAVIIWMASPTSQPTVTPLTGERSLADCLGAVERATKSSTLNIVSAGCMTKEALALIRTML